MTAAEPAASTGDHRPASTGRARTGADVPGRIVGDSAVSSERVVEALLAVSRALVAVAARSLSGQDGEVSLAQYRALVVLAGRGPQRGVDLSAELGVDPSSGTRLVDRLERKGLIRRERSGDDRRVVRLVLTGPGQDLVALVTGRRRAELARIVAAVPGPWPAELLQVLREFAAAAGESPAGQWWLGWTGTGEVLPSAAAPPTDPIGKA